jgi:two-component system NtrC family sensor kinase
VTSARVAVHIPWRHRLATQFIAITGLVLAAIFAGFIVLDSAIEETLLEETLGGAALFGETINAAINRAMLEDRRQAAYGIMEAIGAQRGVERVRMVNKAGVVTFTTGKGVGLVLQRDDPACISCHHESEVHTRVPTSERSRIFKSVGHRAVGQVTPVYNDTRCSAADCHHHPAGARLLGVIDVVVSLAEADRRIDAFRRTGIAAGLFGALVISGLVAALVRRRVVKPVKALVEATHRLARHERAIVGPVAGPGELGALSTAFEEMSGELLRAEDGLLSLNRSLEQKVEERTAELLRAQAALVQSEKLSSLGQLSASIAHEINNPLAGILTYARLLIRNAERDVPDEEKRRELVSKLSMVQRETERCSAIVRNLLDFARERPMRLDDVDVGKVVQESLQLGGPPRELQGPQLVGDLQATPPVRADFGELRQAVVNLTMNAMEAMGRKGRLAVTVRPAPGGGGVELVVADNGPGIPEEIRARIFDPFFTTKEKGTGLGLSVVYGIVQRHGGTIRVDSPSEGGAVFTIALPATLPAAGPAQAP